MILTQSIFTLVAFKVVLVANSVPPPLVRPVAAKLPSLLNTKYDEEKSLEVETSEGSHIPLTDITSNSHTDIVL